MVWKIILYELAFRKLALLLKQLIKSDKLRSFLVHFISDHPQNWVVRKILTIPPSTPEGVSGEHFQTKINVSVDLVDECHIFNSVLQACIAN